MQDAVRPMVKVLPTLFQLTAQRLAKAALCPLTRRNNFIRGFTTHRFYNSEVLQRCTAGLNHQAGQLARLTKQAALIVSTVALTDEYDGPNNHFLPAKEMHEGKRDLPNAPPTMPHSEPNDKLSMTQ